MESSFIQEHLDTILFYGVLIISGSFHEAAHAWSAWRLGDGTARDAKRMTLNPLVHIDLIGTVVFPLINILSANGFLIGWMKPVPVHYGNLLNPRRDILLVSLAGPFTNIVLGLIGSIVLWLLLATGIVSSIGSGGFSVLSLLNYFVMINLVLAVFNLLPIPPLDGSSIVDYIRKDPHGTYHSKGGIGIILLYVGLFAGLFGYLGRTAFYVMVFLVSYPLVTAALLAGFLACLVIFFRKTSPGGKPRARHRGPMDRPRNSNRSTLNLAKVREKVRETAAAVARGEEIPPLDQRLYDKLKSDKGDGQELCSSISFDERNEFCQTCANLSRCLIREAEDEITRMDPK